MGSFASQRAPPTRTLVLGVLLVAVLGIGVAAPLIRLAQAPALAIAFWRMGLSTALTGGLWLVTPAGRWGSRRKGREWALTTLAGLFLGIHFAAWIRSLELTTVAASVVLVNTQPVVVAFLAALFLRERATRTQWAGIVVAVLGAILVSLDGARGGKGVAPLLGDTLALVGAAGGAGYYVIGRSLRKNMGLWAYVTRVYGVSSLVLLGLALAFGTRLAPFPKSTWIIFGALALGPSLFGHTLLNWSLRWLPAAVVNVAALGEPVVAAILAAIIPSIGEVPGLRGIAGALVTLGGISLVLIGPGATGGGPPRERFPSGR